MVNQSLIKWINFYLSIIKYLISYLLYLLQFLTTTLEDGTFK